MKLAHLFILSLAIPTAIVSAQAPSAPAPSDLSFVKIVVDFARNTIPGPIEGDLAFYIDDKLWPRETSDGDLGPLLGAQQPKPGRAMACVLTPKIEEAVCVFFDGDHAYGLLVVKADSKRKFTPTAVAAGFTPITQMAPPAKDVIFTPGDISDDNGNAISSYQLSPASQTK